MLAKLIETQDELREAEQVISLLEAKIKRGIATDAERELYRTTVEDVVIYDWGTESYQNHVPNMVAAAAERKREAKRQRRGLIAPAPAKSLPKQKAEKQPNPEEVREMAKLPPLTRRPGRFAV